MWAHRPLSLMNNVCVDGAGYYLNRGKNSEGEGQKCPHGWDLQGYCGRQVDAVQSDKKRKDI